MHVDISRFRQFISTCQRLCMTCSILKVKVGEKSNDVLFSAGKSPCDYDVVYFGGDIQDYAKVMEAKGPLYNHRQWSLENVAEILQSKYPLSNIWIVKPSNTKMHVFSIYSNFVQSENFGDPIHSPGQGSWQYLASLLEEAKKMQLGGEQLPSRHIRLIGFSKGCIVLNQLLYDLETCQNDAKAFQLITSVKEMIWLDGGHNGNSRKWVTDDVILNSFSERSIATTCHVTPYQMQKPLVKEEQNQFVTRLEQLGVDVTSICHFDEDEASVERHFQLLKEF